MSFSHRPHVYSDPNYALTQMSAGDQSFRGDYDGGTNLVYKGYAQPGSAETDPVWQIATLLYDGNNNVTEILWPELPSGVASNYYAFIWADRTDYTYS